MASEKCETVKSFESLRSVLPEMPESPVVDEEGDAIYRGFFGNISPCPKYVTDGRLLLLASAVDSAVVIHPAPDWRVSTSPKMEDIEKVWNAAEQRSEVDAAFLGCGNWGDLSQVAFVRDAQGRVMVLQAYLLAFAVYAVHPDALRVDAASVDRWFDTSLSLRRDGKLVGLVMPMRVSRGNFPMYDLNGEPIALALEARA